MIQLNKKTMSVPIASLKKKKHYDFVHDDLALEKLMRYYGFKKRRGITRVFEDSTYSVLVINNFCKSSIFHDIYLKNLSAIRYFNMVWRQQE